MDRSPSARLDQFLDKARKASGLEDFAEDFAGADLRSGLGQLLLAIDRTPLTEAGKAGLEGTIDRFLANRLRFHDDMRRHPAILNEDVDDPIVVIGLPRTGTTKLSRMMSIHDHIQPCIIWRMYNPAPFPGTDTASEDPRVAFMREISSATAATNPEFFAMHAWEPEEPDEDGHLHQMSFAHPISWLTCPDPDYLTYLRSLSRMPSYRYVKALLQYLQWQDGGRRGRRWLLKNPTSLGCVSEITEVHPAATIIICERDFSEVIPSFCRMMELIYRQIFVTVDLAQLGQQMLEYWAYEHRRSMAQRTALGGQANIIIAPYNRIVRDGLNLIEEIFERTGLPLTDQDRSAMSDWEAANPKGKHGKAEYSLERYGLTQEQVDRAFA